jgi:alkanesulfonate monooxygenase SsuD/methylene tetrahydromethanopterin reductase-like flavin-dependent oxidoreductase (luciferase family)
MLTTFVEHTSRIQLATAIVNIYSRTSAALAQHFGTLDKLSNGRMIIGLGTSSPQVLEHFHGVKFNPPLTRLKETVEIINLLLAGSPLNYDGKLFKMSRGFKLRFEPFRKHIPIWIASLNSKSVEFTARHTKGWLPSMIPLGGLARATKEFRAVAKEAGRGPNEVEVKSPGHVTITNSPERARTSHAGTVAFYAARMGTYYSEQLARYGFGEDVAKVKDA